MHLRSTLAAALLLLALSGTARAQDGILGSAETIDTGNFKFIAHPVLVFGDPFSDNELGLALRAGYGFSRGLDGEAKVVFFDGFTYFGADVEFWLVRGSARGRKGRGLDVSVSAGAHSLQTEGVDAFGLDGTLLLSSHFGPKFELYAGLDLAWEFPDDPFDSFTRLAIVPGLEYSVAEDIDFLAEVGIGLDKEAFDYLSAGVAYYLR